MNTSGLGAGGWQWRERQDRLIFASIVVATGLLLGGYFVVQKTRHDGDIARATVRIADALERVGGHESPGVCK